jgi:hypothetical protein
MLDPFPLRHICGSHITRVYSPVPVHYSVPGFYSSDYANFEKQVGTERAARVRAKNDDVLKRAKAGKLNAYERRLESLEKQRENYRRGIRRFSGGR